MRIVTFIIVLLAALAPAGAADAPRTGRYDVTFSQRSPLSDYAEFEKRLKASLRKVPAYDIKDESFAVYVPKHYDGEKPLGLLIYMDPGGRGDGPLLTYQNRWTTVLDAHDLIWIGPHKADNKRHVIHRTGLALDAIHNGVARFNIDPDRIYVCGMSGGGRVASWVAFNYPDAVTGMFAWCGVNYFKNVPVPSKDRAVWRAKFPPPPTKLMGRTRLKNRYVLMTGEDDFNREQTKATYDLMVEHKFRHVDYMLVPNLGHVWPPPRWLDEGIKLLDAPLQPDE